MLEPSRHLRMILNRLWNQEAGPQGISEIAFPHTHIMLGDAPHSQLWSGGPLGRDHGKRSGQHDPQAPPSKTQVPPIWHDLACGRVQKSPPVTGSSNRKSPGPSRICRFSVKNMSTLAKNMSIPVQNMSAPAKNMSIPAKNMSIPVKNMSIPAKNMSIPANNMSVVKKKCRSRRRIFWTSTDFWRSTDFLAVDGFLGGRRIFGRSTDFLVVDGFLGGRRIFGRSTDFWAVDGFLGRRRIF